MKPYAIKDSAGTIIRWAGAIELGVVDGKRRRKVVYGKTRAEVSQKLKRLLTDQASGNDLTKASQTVDQFLTRWLAWVRPRVSDRTYESYQHIVKRYLIPTFGRTRLQQLLPEAVDQYISALLGARNGGEALAASYVKKIHAVLRRALNIGVRWGDVHRNVAAMIEAPRVRRRHLQRRALSDEEIRRMIAVSADDWYGPVTEFLAKTGTRRGEGLATRWVDLDLDAGLLYVTGSLQRQGRQGRAEGDPKSSLQRGATKTEYGERVIVLPPSLLPMLRRQRERQQLLCAALRRPWSEEEYVFTSMIGTPVEPRNFNRYFAELVRRAGLPEGTTPHRLRHANITAMITGQVDPRTAQERAGHSDVRVTLGVYTHSNLDLQRAAAAAIDARFASTATPASDA